MPDDVGGFLARELAALPEETRTVLSVAACIGTGFRIDLLARARESAEFIVLSRLILALVPAVYRIEGT